MTTQACVVSYVVKSFINDHIDYVPFDSTIRIILIYNNEQSRSGCKPPHHVVYCLQWGYNFRFLNCYVSKTTKTVHANLKSKGTFDPSHLLRGSQWVKES